MSFQREQFKEYLESIGIYSTSPYCSYLDKIERQYHVDIDREYEIDQCEGLLQTLRNIYAQAADDARKNGQIRNLISKLNKYCQFREASAQPCVATTAEKEEPVPVSLVQNIPDIQEESFFFNANKMTVPMEAYIQQCRSYDEFEAHYLDQFIVNDDRVGKYLESLLWKYDKNQATVSGLAGLDRSYVGNIVRGVNNDPARDVLIAICLAIGTSVDEVQHLLRYAGHAPLYVRRKRDVIIWFAFMKKQSVTILNTELDAKGLDSLIPRRKKATDGST